MPDVGFASWVTAGVAVFMLSRLVAAGRPVGRLGEALIAILAAITCGVAATALDFGGWSELDWRAALFAAFGAAAAAGLSRVTRLLRVRA